MIIIGFRNASRSEAQRSLERDTKHFVISSPDTTPRAASVHGKQ